MKLIQNMYQYDFIACSICMQLPVYVKIDILK